MVQRRNPRRISEKRRPMTASLQAKSYTLPTSADIPRNRVDWELDPSRAVLLIHDMQNYFLAAFPEDLRSSLITNVAALRRWGASHGVPTAYTAQPGRMTDVDRGLLLDFWGPGMRTAAADRAITSELAPRPDDWSIVKWRYSAFFRSDLLDRFRRSGRDQILICGIYAHVGILATALEAFTNDIEVFMVADAVGDFSAEQHRTALTYAAECCAKISTTDEVLSR